MILLLNAFFTPDQNLHLRTQSQHAGRERGIKVLLPQVL